MFELMASGGSRGSRTASKAAGEPGSERPVDGLAAWWRSRTSMLNAGSRRRKALAIARKVVVLEEAFLALDDAALEARRRAVVAQLRRRGLSDTVSIEGLAVVRETCRRQIGMCPYLQQLAAGYALLDNAAIEMDTGEGKTLTTILPAALQGFCGRVVHVVTANDYLSQRDGALLRPALEALGLSVGIIVHGMTPAERRLTYLSDITFVSNKEIAFDYLRDRMMTEKVVGDVNVHLKVRKSLGLHGNTAPVLRGLDVAIVDEIDSVLVDDAGTPLLISAQAPTDTDEAPSRAAFDLSLTFAAGDDFVADPHGIAAEITETGREKVESLANPPGGVWRNRIRRQELVRSAITAINCLERDRHYLVRDGKILIIDEYSGRVMPDRFWGHDLHRMVELKEGCPPSGSRKSLASITFQRFFRSYRSLSGMSGTVREVAAELSKVYGLVLTPIPRRRPLRRRFLGRRLFPTREHLWDETARTVKSLYVTGQPVLIGVRSIEEADRGSRALAALGVPHAMLSAAHDQQEAEIVAQAGQLHAVTIATNMAGRGTDIQLGKGVAELGGLAVLICERHDARRIDRQLMGRCARQGEPGTVIEFLSYDDRILRLASRPLVLLAGLSILKRWSSSWPFRNAQWIVERENARRRFQLVKHDERQRKLLAFAGGLD